MKEFRCISFFLWMVVICLNLPQAVAQEEILSKRISIEINDRSIGRVLKEIEKQAGFHFSYVNKYVPVKKRVSISVVEKPVREILDELFRGEEIEYRIVEGEVILRTARSGPDPAGKILQNFTLSGYIRDALNGESLIGATVIIAGSNSGTVSNAYGFYSLTLQEGSYEILYSFVGFAASKIRVELNKNLTGDLNLVEDPSLIHEVVISVAESRNLASSQKRLGNVDLKPSAVNNMPAFLGEVDVIKSLETIPGISFFGDGSTFFYVRGGNKDQNLITIDDAPIFNPAHLFGLFSNVIPDAIKDVRVYKGDMPASKGGRLSSMVDIRTRDGNMKNFGMSGSMGLAASHLTLEGPVIKDKSSIFISGRHSYIKWFARQEAPSLDAIDFGDLNAKFNAILNTKNRIYFTLYYGKDNFFNKTGSGDASGIKWGNLSGSFRWNHVFSTRLFSNFTFYSGKYDYYLVTSRKRNDAWNSRIGNTGLKLDFSLYKDPETTFRFGLNLGFHRVNPGNFKYGNNAWNSNVPVVPEKRTVELNAYGEYEKQLGRHWLVHAGLRATLWQNWGPTTEYVFDENYNPVAAHEYRKGKMYNLYFTPEPRLGIAYWINNYNALKAGYARNVQNIHQITNSVSPFTSLEVWLPSSPNIKPQKSDQFSLGFSTFFRNTGVDVNIEGYYKHMQNQIDYEYHAQMLINPLLEGELRFGRARSYGIELMLKRDIGNFTGWTGYALSKTTKKIDGIYQNAEYPAFYDRTHDFSVFLSYVFLKRLTLSGTWIYTSGAAFSTPTSFYYYQGYSVPVYRYKNNDRLPPYHRLDLNLKFRLNRYGAKFKHDISLSLYNAYGRKNPISVNFNKTSGFSDNLVIPTNYYTPPVLVPSRMWLYQTIPSINYSFKF